MSVTIIIMVETREELRVRQREEMKTIKQMIERYKRRAYKSKNPEKIRECEDTCDFVLKATIVSHQRQSNYWRDGLWKGPDRGPDTF